MEEDRDKGLEDLETDAGRGRGRSLQADAGSRPDPDQEAGPGLEIDLDHIRQLHLRIHLTHNTMTNIGKSNKWSKCSKLESIAEAGWR